MSVVCTATGVTVKQINAIGWNLRHFSPYSIQLQS